MHAYQKERLTTHLSTLKSIVDLYLNSDSAFSSKVLEWLDDTEKLMGSLRFPEGARMSALRGEINRKSESRRCDSDGKRSPGILRRAKDVAAMSALETAEGILRERLLQANEKLTFYESKLEEAVTAAVLVNIVPEPIPGRYRFWIEKVWKALSEHEATRPTITYIAASLGSGDRLYILEDIMSRLMSRGLPVIEGTEEYSDDETLEEEQLDVEVTDEHLLNFANTANCFEMRLLEVDLVLVAKMCNCRPFESLSEVEETLEVSPEVISDMRKKSSYWKPGALFCGVRFTSEEATAAIRIFNESCFTHLTEVVGLNLKTVDNILKKRPFKDLSQVETLEHVRYDTFKKMLLYLNDWHSLRSFEGSPLKESERKEIVTAMNFATQAQLREDIQLEQTIIEKLVESRPFDDLESVLSCHNFSRRALLDILFCSRIWDVTRKNE